MLSRPFATLIHVSAIAVVALLMLAATGCEWVPNDGSQANTAVATTEPRAATSPTKEPPPEASETPEVPDVPEPPAPEPPAPVVRPLTVHILPEHPGVGETFAVVIDPGTDGPFLSATGTFGTGETQRTLNFAQVGTQWVSMVSISYWLTRGDYPLHLDFHAADGDESRDMDIAVEAREFPEQRITVTAQTASNATDDKVAEDWEKTSAARATSRPLPLWDGRFLIPVEGRVSTQFGMTRYVNGTPSGHHSGLDLAAPKGAPVHATNAGVVVLAAKLNVTGNTVIIDHGMNIFSSYGHMSKLLVAVGDKVERGQVIGEVGSTGFSTGPHLHWTMTIGTGPTNPWVFVNADSLLAQELYKLQYEVNPDPRLR